MIEWNTILEAQVVVLAGADGDETVLYKNGVFDELNALLASMYAGLDDAAREAHDAQAAEDAVMFKRISA
jgi:hypothetical protein